MSGLNQFAAYLFSSGDAFFVGTALIALGRAATWRFRTHRAARWLRLLTVLGVIFFASSVMPLPWWLYALCLIPPLVSLNVPFRTDGQTRWPRILRRSQPLVEILLLASITTELIERYRLYAAPLDTFPSEVHVVGDSLSAGIADEQEHLWPSLLASEWHVPVINHARAGATTASAFRQAEEIECDDCLVLIEIGGNDLLSGRNSQQLEADLDRLLVRLSTPHRMLVMFELPVPPIPGGYEFARAQRRLAHRHAVRLIPRREFANALLTAGATSDGLHLSMSGHRAIANIVNRWLLSRNENTLERIRGCREDGESASPDYLLSRTLTDQPPRLMCPTETGPRGTTIAGAGGRLIRAGLVGTDVSMTNSRSMSSSVFSIVFKRLVRYRMSDSIGPSRSVCEPNRQPYRLDEDRLPHAGRISAAWSFSSQTSSHKSFALDAIVFRQPLCSASS